jgi:hypothetical protein
MFNLKKLIFLFLISIISGCWLWKGHDDPSTPNITDIQVTPEVIYQGMSVTFLIGYEDAEADITQFCSESCCGDECSAWSCINVSGTSFTQDKGTQSMTWHAVMACKDLKVTCSLIDAFGNESGKESIKFDVL